ncbi:MAG: flagellar biosynthetic protein FliO [Myxococcaceae bacterium]
MNLLPFILAATVAAPTEAPKGDDVVAAAFQATPAKTVIATEPGASNVIPVAGALIALAGLAVFLSRRKKALPSSVRIIESASLGPKRTVTVVELMGERLALAVTESGVTVLSRASVELQPEAQAFGGQLVQPTQSEPGFEAELDDAELRAKLAAGLPGVVR